MKTAALVNYGQKTKKLAKPQATIQMVGFLIMNSIGGFNGVNLGQIQIDAIKTFHTK